MGFDKTRFAEAFAAAVLGAAAFEFAKDRSLGFSPGEETLRKFQRSLIIAMTHESFDQKISSRYLERVSDLPSKSRARYFSIVLQPSARNFDEKATAVVIYEHAHCSDEDWHAIVAMYELHRDDNPDRKGTAIDGLANLAKSADETAAKSVRNFHDRLADKEGRRKRRRGLARIYNLFR